MLAMACIGSDTSWMDKYVVLIPHQRLLPIDRAPAATRGAAWGREAALSECLACSVACCNEAQRQEGCGCAMHAACKAEVRTADSCRPSRVTRAGPCSTALPCGGLAAPATRTIFAVVKQHRGGCLRASDASGCGSGWYAGPGEKHARFSVMQAPRRASVVTSGTPEIWHAALSAAAGRRMLARGKLWARAAPPGLRARPFRSTSCTCIM